MRHDQTSPGARAAAVVAAVLALLALVILWRHRHTPDRPHGPVTSHAQAPTPVHATPSRSSEAREHLRRAVDALRNAQGPEESRKGLSALRDALSAMTAATASAVIREYLDSKQDASSHLDFTVGPDGLLSAPSSLRVSLLDSLAQIDPKAAGEYAKGILSRLDSPDEWAVCLRNVARADSRGEDRAYLSEKMRELLRHEPWQTNPAAGFLEAFDVAVHLGGTNLVPMLADLVRKKDNQAVGHAAYLALDRLTIRDGASTLRMLQENPDLMAGREVTRADYFARADVRDPQQRQLVESYLLNPALGGPELEKFTGVYPNANFMVSHNLLTRTETPTGAQLAARDRAALQVVREWLADERFAGRRPHLEQIRQRLQTFVDQAK